MQGRIKPANDFVSLHSVVNWFSRILTDKRKARQSRAIPLVLGSFRSFVDLADRFRRVLDHIL
jgi:hypothetical protein